MRTRRRQFSLRSMLAGMVVTAAIVCVVTGRIADVVASLTHPPLYLLLLYPILFAGTLTLLVTLAQRRRE